MGHMGSHDCVPTIASTVSSTWKGADMADADSKPRRYLTLDEILSTVPPARRAEVMAQYIESVCERERADRWVNQQVRDMSHVPDTIYK